LYCNNIRGKKNNKIVIDKMKKKVQQELIEKIKKLTKEIETLKKSEAKHKQVERLLKESEEKYKTLVEHSLSGITIGQGMPLKTVFANPALSHITGYSINEILSFSYEELKLLIHPDDRELFFNRYKELLLDEKRSVVPQEYRVIRKDGSTRWVDTFAIKIEYQGKPAVQAIFKDITEKKRAEASLRSLLEQYKSLQNNIPIGVFRTSAGADGLIISANPALARMRWFFLYSFSQCKCNYQ